MTICFLRKSIADVSSRENGKVDHFTDHARYTNVISTMMHKMIRDALPFPLPLQACFLLSGNIALG